MNILWVKDGKLGHEKQVNALLEEISSTQHIDITEIKASTVLNQILELITFGLLSKGIDGVENIGFEVDQVGNKIRIILRIFVHQSHFTRLLQHL